MSDIITYDTYEEADEVAQGRAANDGDHCWQVVPGPLYGWVLTCDGEIQ